jgi:hypothetical protein
MFVGILAEIEFHFAEAAESLDRIEAVIQPGGKEFVWLETGG